MLLNKDIGDARMLAKKDRTDYEDKKLIQYYYELFYNTKRPHSSLDGKTPDQVYFNQLEPIPVAA